jgi:pyruvate kinase
VAKRAITIDVRVGEAVSIDGGRVHVVLIEKSGQRARMRIEADEGTPIERVTDRHNVRALGLGERNPQKQQK